jgi:enhancing lycopene biosynthesis protein 2
MHVVNHTNGEEMPESRNVLVESARIARGDVKNISELKSAEFDALFVPGGFGAAKNLSDFGVNGADMQVKDDVASVLKDFHGAKK